MTEQDAKIKKLKAHLKSRKDVVMAFVFGSRATGAGRSQSDWDIAVYLSPSKKRIEWESDLDYRQEQEIWRDCTEILETDAVDLLILNKAPASMAETAIRGTPLVIKDTGVWLKFMSVVTSAAEEYRRFVDEFYAISQRSTSLTPRDQEDLKRTVSFVEEQIRLYSVYQGFTLDDFEQDPRKRNEIERWLENIVNAVIDISKVVLGSKKRRVPPTYREAVARTVREYRLPEEFVGYLERWVKLRNELAHEYLDIKWKRISDFAGTSERVIKAFLEATRKFIKET